MVEQIRLIDFWWENAKEKKVVKGNSEPPLHETEVLINEVFDLTHKENIKKTRETISPTIDAVKLCVSKYSIERSQGQCRK